MTMKTTRQCFLIDSLLEKGPDERRVKEDEEEEEDEGPMDLMKRSPSTSSQPEDVEDEEDEDGEEDGKEDTSGPTEEEPSRLQKLIESMGKQPIQQQPTSPIQQRPLFPMANPMEYLSKLQMMQHALSLSAFALRQPFAPPMLPLLRKDCMFSRAPLLRPPRAVCDVSRSGNTKKYRCDVCDKTFSRSNTLITHKRIHTGEKPFKCEHCGRAFRQPGNLTRHRLTHTTVKPYVCAHCDKAFNRASNLHTHMRTHNGK